MFQIKNSIFSLDISNKGAELQQLCIENKNILWQKSELWNEQSPILFPVVGRVKDGYYIYNSNRYNIPVHGFIKDQLFEAVVHDSNYIKLTSRYTQSTLEMYPFKYEFSIIYQLIDDKLRISIEVKNIDDKEMLFNCGLHPGFSYQGLNELLGDNLRLKFNPQLVKSISFDPCYVSDIAEKKIDNEMDLSKLSKELSVEKTICYQGLTSVSLKSKTKTLKIEMQMPFTAFWQAKPENPKFLCIEPWYGVPDDKNSNHQLENKIFIQRLMPGKTFETYVEISLVNEVIK